MSEGEQTSKGTWATEQVYLQQGSTVVGQALALLREQVEVANVEVEFATVSNCEVEFVTASSPGHSRQSSYPRGSVVSPDEHSYHGICFTRQMYRQQGLMPGAAVGHPIVLLG